MQVNLGMPFVVARNVFVRKSILPYAPAQSGSMSLRFFVAFLIPHHRFRPKAVVFSFVCWHARDGLVSKGNFLWAGLSATTFTPCTLWHHRESFFYIVMQCMCFFKRTRENTTVLFSLQNPKVKVYSSGKHKSREMKERCGHEEWESK